jgi:ABC-type transporter Mla subunit MlaD
VWDVVVWAALAAAVVAGTGAAVRLGLAVLRFFRTLKGSRRALFAQLDSLAAAAEEVGQRAASAGGDTERLTRALARLAASRRRLDVLRQALDEAGDAFAWFRLVYPRK